MHATVPLAALEAVLNVFLLTTDGTESEGIEYSSSGTRESAHRPFAVGAEKGPVSLTVE